MAILALKYLGYGTMLYSFYLLLGFRLFIWHETI